MTEFGANGAPAEAIGSEVRIVTLSNANVPLILLVSVSNSSSFTCLVNVGLYLLSFNHHYHDDYHVDKILLMNFYSDL